MPRDPGVTVQAGGMQTAARASRRPRVLVLAESLPWPCVKGGDLRCWQNVNALAEVADVGVFGLCSNDARRARAPDRPLAFWTTSTDPALTSPPPKDLRLGARAWLLDPNGHPSDLLHSPRADEEIARRLAEFQPSAVLVEGVWLHGYLPGLRAADCRIILDCFNVESVLYRELARTSDRPGLEGRVIRDVLPDRTESIERSAVAAVDQVWVCSEEDERRLVELYSPESPVFVIPNGLDVRRSDSSSRGGRRVESPDDELTIVFPAIFSYFPNAFAAEFLIDQMFPRLVAAADVACRLHLVGAMPTAAMLAAAEHDSRITVTGAVKEMAPHLAGCSVMAVPLFHGGGTRLKILEAFAAGVPVVSTSKGAEGLGVEHGRELLIADTAQDFVDRILEIHGDPTLAQRLTDAARALLVERFSWEKIAPQIHRAVRRILDRRSAA